MMNQWLAELSQIADQNIGRMAFQEPLSQHNSWRIGGPAEVLIEPQTAEQIATVIRFSQSHKLPLLVIGQGTNLLFDDAGVRGIVLKIGEQMDTIRISGQQIIAEGGAWVPQLARLSMRAGLSGLEHVIGIPGTLGGLVMMNGGSQRKGIGENVERVWIVDAAGEKQVLKNIDCCFSYRHSALQGTGCVVTQVELHCSKSELTRVRREMLRDLRSRRQKFPRKQPNCGSVFLSTAEMHATVGPPGKIIEDAGLKGMRVGQAEVSHQHANFIVNLGGASSAEVLSLIGLVRQKVRERIGFELDCEVRYVSPDGTVIPAHLPADSA